MKIVTGTILLTLAAFLLHYVESRPSNNEENYNNNAERRRARGRGRRVTLHSPATFRVIHADYSQQTTLPARPPSIEPVEPTEIYRGPGEPLFNYARGPDGNLVGISNVILPETAPGGGHTRFDYSYEGLNPQPGGWHPNLHIDLNQNYEPNQPYDPNQNYDPNQHFNANENPNHNHRFDANRHPRN